MAWGVHSSWHMVRSNCRQKIFTRQRGWAQRWWYSYWVPFVIRYIFGGGKNWFIAGGRAAGLTQTRYAHETKALMRTTIDLIFVCCVRIFAGAQVTIDINVMMVLAYFRTIKSRKKSSNGNGLWKYLRSASAYLLYDYFIYVWRHVAQVFDGKNVCPDS